MSQISSDAIVEVLSTKYAKVGITTVNNVSDLALLVDSSPDLVFLGMEFVPLEPHLAVSDVDKIWISDFLDAHGIAYTGSSSGAHQLQRNKNLAKQRVIESGLNTSPFLVIRKKQFINENDITLEYPLFVKPLDRGGGYGVDSASVVQNYEDLIIKVKYISNKLDSDSLVEQYLTGREFSVSILKDFSTNKYSAMPIELIAPPDANGARILSGEVKSANVDKAIVVSDELISLQLKDFALKVFLALGARDYGRIDIRLDEDGDPQFLEANLIPSLISGYGSFPKSCLINLGLIYEDMINQIVDLSINRNSPILNERIKPIALELIEI